MTLLALIIVHRSSAFSTTRIEETIRETA